MTLIPSLEKGQAGDVAKAVYESFEKQNYINRFNNTLCILPE